LRFFLALLILGVAFSASATPEPPMTTVSHVDLPRFMGRWYVIANIPTFLEKNAYNATETYALKPDGSIAVTFQFHKGAFDGPLKTMHPHGYVKGPDNAVWGMQFLWPFKAEYRISYLNDEYSQVVIARSARDYVWIMARSPTLTPEDYQRLVDVVRNLGYDTTKLLTVPQRWP